MNIGVDINAAPAYPPPPSRQAMFADFPVCVKCPNCSHFRQLHAFRLIQRIGKKAHARKLPLWQRIENLFYCRRCRRRTPVMITAPMEWA
jgi:ssDNA-binding Zn-finger/Zn-ribbon topoisomerase 1